MKTDDNRDKLKLIKRFFIFNMLQQPSCFININKRVKKSSTNIKREAGFSNNLSTDENPSNEMSAEFTPPIKDVIIENASEFIIPVCDKFSMAKFLVTLRLLQQPRYNENSNKPSKDSPINKKHEYKGPPNELSLFKKSINKLNANFTLFIRQVTFENNSESIIKNCEINTTTHDFYDNSEPKDADYIESDYTEDLPIIIEEDDMDTATQ